MTLFVDKYSDFVFIVENRDVIHLPNGVVLDLDGWSGVTDETRESKVCKKFEKLIVQFIELN